MDADARKALLNRIQIETRAYANADEATRLHPVGPRVGLLEAGVVLGFWSAKARDRASEQVYYRYALHRLPGTLEQRSTGPERPAVQ
jgi:hypothetical protein